MSGRMKREREREKKRDNETEGERDRQTRREGEVQKIVAKTQGFRNLENFFCLSRKTAKLFSCH